MNIRIIAGHMTATDKAAVRQMLDQGLTAAATKRIRFYLTPVTAPNVFDVVTVRRERDDLGRMFDRRYRATFEAVTP